MLEGCPTIVSLATLRVSLAGLTLQLGFVFNFDDFAHHKQTKHG